MCVMQYNMQYAKNTRDARDVCTEVTRAHANTKCFQFPYGPLRQHQLQQMQGRRGRGHALAGKGFWQQAGTDRPSEKVCVMQKPDASTSRPSRSADQAVTVHNVRSDSWLDLKHPTLGWLGSNIACFLCSEPISSPVLNSLSNIFLPIIKGSIWFFFWGQIGIFQQNRLSNAIQHGEIHEN